MAKLKYIGTEEQLLDLGFEYKNHITGHILYLNDNRGYLTYVQINPENNIVRFRNKYNTKATPENIITFKKFEIINKKLMDLCEEVEND